jgi:hypothetical protein
MDIMCCVFVRCWRRCLPQHSRPGALRGVIYQRHQRLCPCGHHLGPGQYHLPPRSGAAPKALVTECKEERRVDSDKKNENKKNNCLRPSIFSLDCFRSSTSARCFLGNAAWYHRSLWRDSQAAVSSCICCCSFSKMLGEHSEKTFLYFSFLRLIFLCLNLVDFFFFLSLPRQGPAEAINAMCDRLTLIPFFLLVQGRV